MLRFLDRDHWPLISRHGRLHLRPLQLGDIPTIALWLRDPELVQMAFGLHPDAPSLDRIGEEYCREIRNGRRNVLALDTPAGEFIGFVRFSLRSTARGLVARVGILLGPRAQWGRGLGTEAMQTLVKFLFERRRVVSVELDTAEFNTRAQRCFEKCGFLRRGEMAVLSFLHSGAASKVWMELTRERWQSLQACGAPGDGSGPGERERA
ncbi:MAG TPA: GNAT family N-acetyltransferase [Candidatus Nitrosotenuis sp.]|nr:GNAT family N-acetyltransferase [Candidatus Nitrosotenuis sp.]